MVQQTGQHLPVVPGNTLLLMAGSPMHEASSGSGRVGHEIAPLSQLPSLQHLTVGDVHHTSQRSCARHPSFHERFAYVSERRMS